MELIDILKKSIASIQKSKNLSSLRFYVNQEFGPAIGINEKVGVDSVSEAETLVELLNNAIIPVLENYTNQISSDVQNELKDNIK